MNSSSIDNFTKEYILNRSESLFNNDLKFWHNKMKSKIDGRNVMVIGGAGTIGSSFIKEILKFNISKLVVVDINENGLTELVRDLRSSSFNMPKNFITYPIDFGNKVFEKVFKNHGKFEIVANFAAHKHVRSEKDIFSIQAMIENNLLKARGLLDLLVKYPPQHFFCVSTDKAANPVNIMGASKKLMEELIMAYSSKINITTSRFANVAFSNGSLPLGFINRLNKNQPWSCPIGIKRFFVSPEESGQLCLIACVLGKSGEIFFPKLDEKKDMISFDDIVKDLLRYLGLEIDICESEEEAKRKSTLLSYGSKKYPVYFFKSDTSGEKTYEEFYTKNEILDLEKFENLGIIKNSVKRNLEEIENIYKDLANIFISDNISKEEIIKAIIKYLPNFQHIETGKHLDQKM
jgi:FlaA1/EpsC-like NDP-sugar epimerase